MNLGTLVVSSFCSRLIKDVPVWGIAAAGDETSHGRGRGGGGRRRGGDGAVGGGVGGPHDDDPAVLADVREAREVAGVGQDGEGGGGRLLGGREGHNGDAGDMVLFSFLLRVFKLAQLLPSSVVL